jgi:hypothetical protein
MTDNGSKIEAVQLSIGGFYNGTSMSWRITVQTLESNNRPTVYQAITWAEVEARVRRILDEHGIPADPVTRLEAMQVEQARGSGPRTG